MYYRRTKMKVHKRYHWAVWFKHAADSNLKQFNERLFWNLGMPKEPPAIDEFFAMYQMGGEL